ncbi:MAG: zf-HC2 domain-containing protein [Clostridia bacterium]|nr:zf-HC2 domain-containing protein [Clostridia bacterium]
MNCDDFHRYIYEYIDNTLSEDLKESFESHIEKCDKCKQDLYTTKTMLDALHSMPKLPVPEDFASKLNERLNAEIKPSSRSNLRKIANYASSLAACVLLFVLIKGGIGDMLSKIQVSEDETIFSTFAPSTQTPASSTGTVLATSTPTPANSSAKNTPKVRQPSPSPKSVNIFDNTPTPVISDETLPSSSFIVEEKTKTNDTSPESHIDSIEKQNTDTPSTPLPSVAGLGRGSTSPEATASAIDPVLETEPPIMFSMRTIRSSNCYELTINKNDADAVKAILTKNDATVQNGYYKLNLENLDNFFNQLSEAKIEFTKTEKDPEEQKTNDYAMIYLVIK